MGGGGVVFITRKKWKMQTVKNGARQKSDSSALSATGGERQQHQQREYPSEMHTSTMSLMLGSLR